MMLSQGKGRKILRLLGLPSELLNGADINIAIVQVPDESLHEFAHEQAIHVDLYVASARTNDLTKRANRIPS